MSTDEFVTIRSNFSNKRDVSIRVLLAICETITNSRLRSEKLNRMVREIFIFILLDYWAMKRGLERLELERVVSFSERNKKERKSLLLLASKCRKIIPEKCLDELDYLIDSEDDSIEASLAMTMCVHDICMDVRFERVRKNQIKINYSSKRREEGIHYTPWDLALWMARCLHESSHSGLRILDPAMGSGCFLLACKATFGDDTVELFGGDIDPIAVFSTRLQLRYLHDDSETDEMICERIVKMNFLSREGGEYWKEKGINAIIMNPPYVSPKGEKKSLFLGFRSSKCRNLSVYFLERCYEIVDEGSKIVTVVPINIATGGSAFNSIRTIMLEESSRISMKHIDIVPGYLFDQGKMEVGDGSKSVSTRVTIIDVETGSEPQFHSTRFIRWKTDDRKGMMDIKPEKIPKKFLHLFDEGVFPMGGKCDFELLTHMNYSDRLKIKNIVSKNGEYYLQILKPVRYYVSAGFDVHNRTNTISLRFESIQERNAAFAIIVSGTFFWWWRCFGNGQQLRTPEVENFPWPVKCIDDLAKLGEQLIAMADDEHIKVTTSNKGTYSSLAYRHGMDVIVECDRILSGELFPKGADYCDFLASCRFPNYKYYDKPRFDMKRIMTHTTPTEDREAVLAIVMEELERLSEERTFLSMDQMYRVVEKMHEDTTVEFALTPIQLMMHRQRSGPVENHYKHDLKNSLSNAKSKGLVINPKKDQWGWPQPVSWFDEIVDRVGWEKFKTNARKHRATESKFKVLNVADEEIQVCKSSKEETKYSINQKLIDNKVQHLLNCGGIMDSSAFHSWIAPRDAIIKFHPNLEYTRRSKNRVRYVR